MRGIPGDFPGICGAGWGAGRGRAARSRLAGAETRREVALAQRGTEPTERLRAPQPGVAPEAGGQPLRSMRGVRPAGKKRGPHRLGLVNFVVGDSVCAVRSERARSRRGRGRQEAACGCCHQDRNGVPHGRLAQSGRETAAPAGVGGGARRRARKPWQWSAERGPCSIEALAVALGRPAARPRATGTPRSPLGSHRGRWGPASTRRTLCCGSHGNRPTSRQPVAPSRAVALAQLRRRRGPVRHGRLVALVSGCRHRPRSCGRRQRGLVAVDRGAAQPAGRR